MSRTDDNRRSHWQSTYSAKAPGEVSWHQEKPRLSLKLLRDTGVSLGSPIIDIGGGASTLVDHLLRQGFTDISVLDVAEAGLQHAKRRLGEERAARIDWIVADVTAWRPARRFGVWHDRAALHFLTNAEDQGAYARALHTALKPGGWAIVGGFAPGGQTRCSGLDIVQHDGASLSGLFGPALTLVSTHAETHVTPWGAEQPFRYHLFRQGT